MEWILPLVFVGILSLFSGVMLTVFSKIFEVKGEESFEEVRACLPGINCSMCGYPNCDAYAQGILDGDSIEKCRPGGASTLKKLQEVLAK